MYCPWISPKKGVRGKGEDKALVLTIYCKCTHKDRKRKRITHRNHEKMLEHHQRRAGLTVTQKQILLLFLSPNYSHPHTYTHTYSKSNLIFRTQPDMWVGGDIWLCLCFTGTRAASPRMLTQKWAITTATKSMPWPMGNELTDERMLTIQVNHKNKGCTYTYPHKLTLILTTPPGFRVRHVSFWHQWGSDVLELLLPPQDLCGGASLHHLAKTCFLLYPRAPT